MGVEDHLQKFINEYDFNKSVDLKYYFESLNTNNKDNKINRKCMFPNCNKRAIKKSHIIQRAILSNNVAKNNKVYIPRLMHRDSVPNYEMCEIGVNEAAIFSGFCTEHESYFSSFEKKISLEVMEDFRKQIFRLSCYYVRMLEIRSNKWQRDSEKYTNAVTKQFVIDVNKEFSDISTKIKLTNVNIETGYALFMKQRMSKTDTFIFESKKFFEASKIGELELLIFEVPFLIPVVIDYLMPIYIENQASFYLLFFIIPYNDRTQVILAVQDSNSHQLKRFEKYLECSLFKILNFIENAMIGASERWYLNPTVWDCLHENKKAQILKDVLTFQYYPFYEYPYSIFDDLRRKIIDEYKANIDKINEKEELELILKEEELKLTKIPKITSFDTVETIKEYHMLKDKMNTNTYTL